LTRSWPKEEQYGLIAQIRRAAVSIPSNIAEGQGRRAPREFVHFLNIAHGSIREVETQLIIGRRLGYLAEPDLQAALELAGETGRLTAALANAIAATIA
jgi:four helix bundle protein